MYFLQGFCHNLWTVVDSQNNIRDTSSSQTLHLVQNHGLVCELDERLRERKGLSWSVNKLIIDGHPFRAPNS